MTEYKSEVNDQALVQATQDLLTTLQVYCTAYEVYRKCSISLFLASRKKQAHLQAEENLRQAQKVLDQAVLALYKAKTFCAQVKSKQLPTGSDAERWLDPDTFVWHGKVYRMSYSYPFTVKATNEAVPPRKVAKRKI